MRRHAHNRMVHMKDGLHRLGGPVSVFKNIVVCFLLQTQFCGGQSQVIGPLQPVIAMVGDDVVLPCQLEPPVDAVSMTMEWRRLDLEPRFVHVWHEGQELLADQNEAYKGRTSLSVNKLKLGDISLKLSRVKISDNGTYRCYIPRRNKEYVVGLHVGAASSAAVSLAGINKTTNGVMLQCESEGWYPEPELLWLDAEGNLLSAGPPETLRGPDDVYTVSSRVTVDKRDNTTFTCRVQQKDTNQTRETHIHVPVDFFMAPSTCTASIAISFVFGLMLVLAASLLFWKWKQNKIETKTTTEQPLMEADRRKENEKVEEEVNRKEGELNDMTQVINVTQVISILTELKAGLKKQKEKHQEQINKTEELVKKTDDEVKSLEKKEREKEGDQIKDQGYYKLKELVTENKRNWEKRKEEQEQLDVNIDDLIQKTTTEIEDLQKKEKNMKKQEEIERKA